MKRFIVILAAIVVLPTAALADSVTMDVTDIPNNAGLSPTSNGQGGFTLGTPGTYYYEYNFDPSNPTSGDDFLTVYAQATFNADTGTPTDKLIEEFQVSPSGPYTITIENDPAGPESLDNIGFMLSPTLIPLDDLNFNLTPPPGQPSSPFTPLPSLDSTLQSGGSESLTVTPLPSSFWAGSFLFGGIALAKLRRKPMAG